MTMRVNVVKPIEHDTNSESASGVVPLVLMIVGVAWGIWSVAVLLGNSGSEPITFDALAGWFVLLAIVYLALHGLSGSSWYSVPVLVTLRALLEFIGIPAWRFASGDDLVDPVYVHAMFLVLIGFASFWIGSVVLMKETALRFVTRMRDTSGRVACVSFVMLGLGAGGTLVLWQAGLYSYSADAGLRESSLGFIQWLAVMADLLKMALLVSAIEVLGKRSTGLLIRITFWISLIGSLLVGGISGMKSQIVEPLLCLAVISGITTRRIPRAAFLLPLLLVPIYPFVTAYRQNLNSGYRDQVNTLGGVEAVLAKSFADSAQSRATTSEQAEDTFDQATGRLSLLADVSDIVGLPDPTLLNGDAKIWLAPFYPFIPRFLWDGKPVLNKGQRVSEALGRPSTTSSAVTPIGDLYSMYGAFGVVVGMFVYGMSLQLYMNWAGGAHSEKGLFIYISMLMPLINLEEDAVALVAGAVQLAIIVLVTSYVVYGRSPSSLRAAKSLHSISAP
jgi:hypothetical protein